MVGRGEVYLYGMLFCTHLFNLVHLCIYTEVQKILSGGASDHMLYFLLFFSRSVLCMVMRMIVWM